MKHIYKALLLVLLLLIATPASAQAGRYHLAQARADGSFSVLETFDTVEAAVTRAKARTESTVVVRDTGRTRGNGVVYMKEGQVITDPARAGMTLLTYGQGGYSSYVGSGYDALFLEGNGTGVTIELMGMRGAVNASGTRRPIDQVELIPANQVGAMSYYTRQNGQLTHRIQSFRYNSTQNKYLATESTIRLGGAPGFMTEGVRYYSYDAYAFYRDIFNGSAAGQFDPYFKTLPMRSYSNYSAEELNRYIASWGLSNSKLNGTGAAFIRAQEDTGVNAAMLLAMAAHESGRGTSTIARDKNNLFGINATDDNPYGNATTFYSVDGNIIYQAKTMLNNRYLNPNDGARYHGPHLGDKGSGMNVKYASDPYWGEKITGHMIALDNYLGGKDANFYTIKWSFGDTYAYAAPGADTASLYRLQNRNGSYPHAIPTILLGQTNGYRIIQSIMPVAGGTADISLPYTRAMVAYIRDSGASGSDVLRVTTDRLNVRSTASTSGSILGTLEKDTLVSGTVQGNWFRVNYRGRTGYLHTDWLKVPEAAPQPTTVKMVTTERLNVRAAASTSSSVLGTLEKGTVVEGTLSAGWLRISYRGQTGYLAADWLTSAEQTAPAPTQPQITKITTDRLNVRSGPGTTHRILGQLNPGTEITGTLDGGWFRFSYNGQTAYVSATYLKDKETAAPPPAPAPVSKETTDRLNVRSGPGTGYSILGQLARGTTVQGTLQGDWFRIVYNGKTAYVSADYLKDPAPAQAVTSKVTTARLNVRSGAGTGYSVLGVLPLNTQIQGTLQGDWFRISYNGKTGYVSADYLKDPAPVPTTVTRITTDRLNVRSGAGTGYSVLGVLAQGTEVKGTVTGSWLRISYNGKTGYLHTDYLR